MMGVETRWKCCGNFYNITDQILSFQRTITSLGMITPQADYH